MYVCRSKIEDKYIVLHLHTYSDYHHKIFDWIQSVIILYLMFPYIHKYYTCLFPIINYITANPSLASIYHTIIFSHTSGPTSLNPGILLHQHIHIHSISKSTDESPFPINIKI